MENNISNMEENQVNKAADTRRWKIMISFICAALLILYFALLCRMFERCLLNSDSANLILEAADFAGGNVFLKDWILTGVSFITTDLLAHVIAVIFAGVTPFCASLAGAIVIFALTAASMSFIVKPSMGISNIWGISFFMAFAGFPGVFLMDSGRYHTAAVVSSMLGLFIVMHLRKLPLSGKTAGYVISVILFSTAVMSDAVSILVIIGPLMAVSLYELLEVFYKGSSVRNLHMRNLIITVLSVILGFILDKLYFIIGGADKNSFLDGKSFLKLEDIPDKGKVFVEAVLRLANADFPGQKIFEPGTAFYFIRVTFLLLGLIFAIKSVYDWIVRRNTDYIAVVLSIGVIITCCIFILTDIAIDIYGARYLGTVPALLAVIIIRSVRRLSIAWPNRRALVAFLTAGIIAAVILGTQTVYCVFTEESEHLADHFEASQKLARVLTEQNLTSGYASFWEASNVTVMTDNKVHVRAVCESSGRIDRFTWFCKNTWYKEPANFIVTDEDDGYGVTFANVVRVMGKPQRIIAAGERQILVYDRDISSYFDYDFGDGILYAADWYRNDRTDGSPGRVIVFEDGSLWGPYYPLKKGVYEVRVHGKDFEGAVVDVYSSRLDKSFLDEEEIGQDAFFCFELTEDVDDIEIRVKNRSITPCELYDMILEKKE